MLYAGTKSVDLDGAPDCSRLFPVPSTLSSGIRRLVHREEADPLYVISPSADSRMLSRTESVQTMSTSSPSPTRVVAQIIGRIVPDRIRLTSY